MVSSLRVTQTPQRTSSPTRCFHRSSRWAYHIDALFTLKSFIAPQAGRRVVWEGVKRAGGGVGPQPGGRERPSSTCRKSARTEFPLHPPHDAVPAVRTQQPCDDIIWCRDIMNPRSTLCHTYKYVRSTRFFLVEHVELMCSRVRILLYTWRIRAGICKCHLLTIHSISTNMQYDAYVTATLYIFTRYYYDALVIYTSSRNSTLSSLSYDTYKHNNEYPENTLAWNPPSL